MKRWRLWQRGKMCQNPGRLGIFGRRCRWGRNHNGDHGGNYFRHEKSGPQVLPFASALPQRWSSPLQRRHHGWGRRYDTNSAYRPNRYKFGVCQYQISISRAFFQFLLGSRMKTISSSPIRSRRSTSRCSNVGLLFIYLLIAHSWEFNNSITYTGLLHTTEHVIVFFYRSGDKKSARILQELENIG